ncbi:Retrovirus-related Pol polyprotein from transposon 17.6, partial [Lamellibrachia satsuma]
VLKNDAKPYSVTTARVPFPLLSKVEAELILMENEGITEEGTEPTDWCVPIVPVLKKNGNIRICVDLKKLNEAVKRERYILLTLEDAALKVAEAKVFSTLDAANGFYQLPLDKESSKLTTFITPMGRFCFRRVPFGITSAPEFFQKKITDLLDNQDGAKACMDDILIYGANVEEHDSQLNEVLDKVKKAGLQLNRDKCHIRQSEILYYGHIISG